jgi:hypothetical protein
MMASMSGDRPPRNHALWLGPLIAFGGMVSYFEFFARFPTLRDFPWINLPLVLIGIALSLGGFWGAYTRGSRLWVKLAGSFGLALSLLSGGFLIAYVFAISNSLPAESATTTALEQAPDFALEDSEGRVHRLSDYSGSKVVLVFYRGHW